MCSFFNPEIFCAEKCAICQKKTNIILRSSCHLCENYFCSQCSFSSHFLPKNRDAIFSSGKSCAVCALTWLIPSLEESQMVKLPTKLLVAICKVYNVQIFVSSEKKELVAELKKQNPSLRGFPLNYKDNWPQVSIKIKDSKNILPQIENALKNMGRVSSSGSENLHGESSHFANEPRTQNRFQRYSSPRDNPVDDRTWPDAFNSNSSEPPSSVPFNEETSYFNRSNFHDFNSRPRNMGSSSGFNGTSTGHPQPPASYHEPNTESPPPGLNLKKDAKAQKKVYTLKQLMAEETRDDMVKCLPVSVLKDILRENFVNFDGVIEKSVLVQKVTSLIASLRDEEMFKEAQTTSSTSLEDHKLNSNFEDEEGLCKICFEEKANCVLLECGHSISCVDCGKELLRLNQPCPICRTDIVRVVRIFR